jgi:hypothetical protein
MSINNPTCETGCLVELPPFSFNDCSPDVNFGQIDRIYFAARGANDFVDWTSLAEWTGRLDNTTDDLQKIRFLNVIGTKPAAEGDPIEISRKRKITAEKTHTVTARIDETNEENYDALRALECDGNVKMWYQAGKYLYGDNSGIDAFIQINDEIPENNEELNVFQVSATWEAEFHPDRITNPLPTI